MRGPGDLEGSQQSGLILWPVIKPVEYPHCDYRANHPVYLLFRHCVGNEQFLHFLPFPPVSWKNSAATLSNISSYSHSCSSTFDYHEPTSEQSGKSRRKVSVQNSPHHGRFQHSCWRYVKECWNLCFQIIQCMHLDTTFLLPEQSPFKRSTLLQNRSHTASYCQYTTQRVTTDMRTQSITPSSTGLMPVLRMESMDIPEPMRKSVTDKDLWENMEMPFEIISGMET